MKSYIKPTDDEVEAAIPLLSSSQHEAYFFDRLETPLWIRFSDVSDLSVHLAEGHEADAALRLATSLYAPVLPKSADEQSEPDRWRYREGLKSVIPVLARTIPGDFLSRISEWLKTTIE